MNSLRRRLLLSIGGTTLLVWIGTSALIYREAHHEVSELLDAQLVQTARVLVNRVAQEEARRQQRRRDDEHEHDDDREEVTKSLGHDDLYPYAQDQAFAIWRLPGPLTGATADTAEAQLILRSDNAQGLERLPGVGFREVVWQGHTWRVIALRDPHQRFQVEVAQPTANRDEATMEITVRVAVPLALALPLLIVVLFLAVRRGLVPLDSLAGEVSQRQPGDLRPLPDADVPQEARPLVDALNTLLARMARTLDNERRFTADAAHELRTPLAALKVQAQVAGMADDAGTRKHALDQLLGGVNRATHLVEQLLRLARLDPLVSPPTLDACALVGQLLVEARDSFAETADAKRIQLTLAPDLPEQSTLGDPDMLALALRNLVENAVRYTHAGGHIELGYTCSGNELQVWVRDNGPGASPADLARLAERFYRSREVTQEGSGLGLAIVQRIAELHGGRLQLANRAEGGFEASLILPRRAC
jgi:two-component system sensor histidine kinase QseC